MSTPDKTYRRYRSRPWWIAGALSIVAVAAVSITVPVAVHALRHSNTGATAVPPGLASLSDQQLADLLPRPADFPPSWIVKSRPLAGDRFVYKRQSPTRRGPYRPAECEDLVGAPTGTATAVDVAGRASTPRSIYPAETPDIRLGVGRVYDPAGFDAMISLATRCAHYRFAKMLQLDLTVLQNSRSANGIRIFRFAVTSTDAETPAQPSRTEYTSYAMLSALIVSATATPGHQDEFDGLFDGVVSRIEHHR